MIQEKSNTHDSQNSKQMSASTSASTNKQSVQCSSTAHNNCDTEFMSTSTLGQHEIIQQYYKYISLLKRSDNLYQDPSRYKDIPESMYSNLTLIGSIHQLKNVNDQENKACISISLITTIKYPSYFLNNVTNDPVKILKKEGKQLITKENIKRNLILLKEDYIAKQNAILFNKIMIDCKSNVHVFQKIYFFTGLQMQILNGNVYFAITDNSCIGSLQNQLYFRIFNPLQKSLGFFYSYVHTNYQINKDDEGYSLQAFQNQFRQMEKVSFTGVVQNYYIYNDNKNQLFTTFTQNPQKSDNNYLTNISKTQSQKFDNNSNAKQKDKQIVIEVLQQNYRGKIEMIGIAKIIGKFHPKDQEQILNYIQTGKIYLFSNLSLDISDNLAVNFKFNGKINNFITPIHKQANPNILPILDKVNIFQLRSLNTPVLYRNIIKFEASYVNCQFLFGKVQCGKCQKIMQTRGICSNCGQNKGKLQLWAIVIVADETSYAQISLESSTVLDYFNFSQDETQEIYDMIFKQEIHNNKKMKKLFSFQTKFQTNNLSKFQKKLLFNFSCKTLVGVPKYNSNDTFKQLSIDEKQEFLTSFYTTKQFIKKNNKVQFNGHSIKIDKQKKIVPVLKIKHVL